MKLKYENPIFKNTLLEMPQGKEEGSQEILQSLNQ